MKKVWLSAIAPVLAVIAMTGSAQANPTTGSIGWGFGGNDPSGPFMTGYSDSGGYQENVYSGGGPIKTGQWQTLSYTVDNIHSDAPTITTSVGNISSSSTYNLPVSVPTDIFLAFGQGVNGGDVPFGAPIYVNNFQFSMSDSNGNNVVSASEPISYAVGTNLLSGSVAGWSDLGGTGIPLYVEKAPDGSTAAAVTDANGFSGGFTIPDWTFPAVTQDQFNSANSMSFSIQVFWPAQGTPEPSSFVLLGLAGVGLVGYAGRRRIRARSGEVS